MSRCKLWAVAVKLGENGLIVLAFLVLIVGSTAMTPPGRGLSNSTGDYMENINSTDLYVARLSFTAVLQSWLPHGF